MDEQERAEIAAAGFDPDFVALVRRVNRGEEVGYDLFDAALPCQCKDDALYHLMLFGTSIPPETLRRLLGNHWSAAEFTSRFGVPNVVEVFRRAGFVTDTEGVTAPTEPLTVYRGVGPVKGRAKGLSWTLDEGKAEWFAKRFAFGSDAPGIVHAAEVGPAGVLGILHGSGESEVLVNPRRLRNVRELRRVWRDAA